MDNTPEKLTSAEIKMQQLAERINTLNMKLIARAVNGLILLLLLFWVFLKVNRKQSIVMVSFFTVPCLLILVGFGINFLMGLSAETLGQASKFIPWLALLVVSPAPTRPTTTSQSPPRAVVVTDAVAVVLR